MEHSVESKCNESSMAHQPSRKSAESRATRIDPAAYGAAFVDSQNNYRSILQAKGPVKRSREIHQTARKGIQGASQPLPYRDVIQRSFGKFDVSTIQSHQDASATAANEALNSLAYTIGNHIAFRNAPDLHTTAHEAAHVVQQAVGVRLQGGIGKTGDCYEKHADAVADTVVRGGMAEALLTQVAPEVQRGKKYDEPGGWRNRTGVTQGGICDRCESVQFTGQGIFGDSSGRYTLTGDDRTVCAQTIIVIPGWSPKEGAGLKLPEKIPPNIYPANIPRKILLSAASAMIAQYGQSAIGDMNRHLSVNNISNHLGDMVSGGWAGVAHNGDQGHYDLTVTAAIEPVRCVAETDDKIVVLSGTGYIASQEREVERNASAGGEVKGIGGSVGVQRALRNLRGSSGERQIQREMEGLLKWECNVVFYMCLAAHRKNLFGISTTLYHHNEIKGKMSLWIPRSDHMTISQVEEIGTNPSFSDVTKGFGKSMGEAINRRGTMVYFWPKYGAIVGFNLVTTPGVAANIYRASKYAEINIQKMREVQQLAGTEDGSRSAHGMYRAVYKKPRSTVIYNSASSDATITSIVTANQDDADATKPAVDWER